MSEVLDDTTPAVGKAKQALGGRKGFETRRQKRAIAAKLFGRPAAPTMLDRYTVIRELGAGGMGRVYLAYDAELDRRVAIKLLRPSVGGRPSSRSTTSAASSDDIGGADDRSCDNAIRSGSGSPSSR